MPLRPGTGTVGEKQLILVYQVLALTLTLER